jgi:plasmid stabilization system protein ParE
MKVEWAPLALADREAVFDFIEAKGSRAAVTTDERIAATVRRLGHFPEIGRPGRVTGTRELVVDGAHFVVVYRYHGGSNDSYDDESITVLRVLHTSRRWPDTLD